MHKLGGAPSGRTVGVIGILLILGFGSVNAMAHFSAVHPDLGPAPRSSLSGVSVGANALAQAQASLRAGLGPAGNRPAATVASPSWSNITLLVGPGPGPRVTQMAWDASDGYVVLFSGGSPSGIGIHADTWTYSNGAWTNITPTVAGSPPALLAAGMAYDPSTQRVILFGGENRTAAFQAQTWSYHAKSWTNLTALAGSPPAAIVPALSTDSTDNQLVLYGGQLKSTLWGTSTWTYKNGIWTNVTSIATVNAVIGYPSLADDPMGHGAFLFGQMIWKVSTPQVVHPGTSRYSGGLWQNLTPTLASPSPPQILSSMAYLPLAGGIFAWSFGASNPIGTTFVAPTTWEFVNGGWKNLTGTLGFGPDNGIFVGAAMVPTDDSLLIMGGAFRTPSASTWALSFPLVVTAAGSRSVLDAGMAVTLNGTVSGGLSPNQIHWTLGDGTNSTALASSHTFARAGLYSPTLTATDLTGRQGSASVPLYVNPALSAVANASPGNPTATNSVTLLSAIAGGTAPFTYAWSLGDGGTASTANPSHVYAKSGTYAVLLKVTDSLGAGANATLSVVVGAAPSTAVSLTSGTGLGLLAGIVVLAIIAAVLGVLLLRKPRPPAGPPMPFASGPGAYPPSPPPGGSGPYPPPPG